jgi:hypothetical protein
MPLARFPIHVAIAVALLTGSAAAQPESPRQLITSIAQHAALVHAELRFARTDGHRARVRCLNGKLSEIHAQGRLARERERMLAAAVARHQDTEAAQSRRMLVALRDRARQLSLQAQGCGRFGSMPPSGYRLRVIAAR